MSGWSMASSRKTRSTQTTETFTEPVAGMIYAKMLTSTMSSLRDRKEICDMTIQVGDESFPVHRIVLISASNYFYELIKGDKMKDGVLQLEDIKSRAVRGCIEYIYEGKTSVTMDTAFDILSAAEKFNLHDLIEMCLEFLSANISVENCFNSKMAFEKRGLSTRAQKVDVFIARNFELLAGTDKILNLKRNDFSFYVRNAESDVGLLYQAVKNWVIFDLSNREQHYPVVISCITNSFGVKFMLDTVWPDPLTARSKPAKDLISVAVLEDVTTLAECLTRENCFHAHEICGITRHGNRSKAQGLVNLFIAENFDELCRTKGFVTLGKDAVFEIFRSSKTERVSDKLKWHVAQKWIHHDLGRRKQFFPALLSSIRLENTDFDFLQSVVRADKTVQEFDQCKDMIMDAFYAIANLSGTKPLTLKSDKPGKAASLRGDAVVSRQRSPSPCMAPRKRPLNAEDAPENFERAKKTPDFSLADVDYTETQSQTGKPHLAIYDPDTGLLKGLNIGKLKWSDLVSTTVAKGVFQGVVAHQNILYLLKGADLFTVDVARKTWVRRASKQEQPAMWSKLLACENQVYVLQNGHIDLYDIERDQWVEKKPFASLCVGFSSCLLLSNIYVMGGLSMLRIANRYDLSTESVIEIASMMTGRSHAAAASLNGKVYVLGGSSEVALSSIEWYDPTADVWTTGSQMQKDRSGLCACVYDGKIYAVGGKPHRTRQTKSFDTIEVYELAKEGRYKWRFFHELIAVSHFASGCVLNIPCE